MRIAHILRKYNSAEWGGTETAIHRLVEGLDANDVESIIYAPELARKIKATDPFAASGGSLRRFHSSLTMSGISAERRQQLIAVGGNIVSFDLPLALWRESAIDVIHSHALGRLGAIAQQTARAGGRPFVVSVHGGVYDLPPSLQQTFAQPTKGWDWGRPLGFLLGARGILARADAIVTCNPREAALIRQRHPDRHVVVQPHGVRAADFARDHRAAARSAFPNICDRPVLFMPGRIDGVKNQGWLVERAAELVRRHPGVLLVFAGAVTDREYGDALQARIVQQGLEASVLLAGQLPPGDPRLIGLLQEARAVLLPSVSETFGLVILEAWAAGTPTISNRTSGAVALIEDGKDGFLFDLAQPEEFHAAVARVLADDGCARELGAAGRLRVLKDFDTSVLARRMRTLYQHLIDQKHALRHPARR